MQQQDKRLSQAFPPNSQSNSSYIAEIHNVLATIKIDDIGFKDIKFRNVQTKRDIAQLKQLQLEWFPIDYSEQFYTAVLNGVNSSLIAEIEIKFHTGRKERFIIGAMIFSNVTANQNIYKPRHGNNGFAHCFKRKCALHHDNRSYQ